MVHSWKWAAGAATSAAPCRGEASATRNAWDLRMLSGLLERTAFLWRPLYRLQFRFFRHATGRGHEFFVLARKPD
jgi:hypothetical protein